MKERLSQWYISGNLQRVVTYLVFLMLGFLFAGIMEFICTSMVLNEALDVLSEYVPINQGPQVKAKLEATSGGFGFQLFMIVLIMALIGRGLIKLSTHLNLVGSVTLNKALRFADAMERIGLTHEWEQLHFIRHYKIPLYIAASPLLTDVAEGTKASLYPFVQTLAASTDFIAAEKGRKRLCLKAEDLENTLAQLSQKSTSSTPPAEEAPASLCDLQTQVANLKMEKKVLQSQFVESDTKIKELEALNSEIKNERNKYARKEGKDDKAQQRLFLYALGLAPIFQAIVTHKPDRRDVTRAAFCSLFKNSLNDDATLKSLLLGIGETTPDKLPDYICDLAWDFLKNLELTNTSGSDPAGNMARLKRMFLGGE